MMERNLFRALSIFFFLSLYVACAPPVAVDKTRVDGTDPNTVPPSGDPSGGSSTVVNSAGFFLKLSTTTVSATLHKATAGESLEAGFTVANFSEECRIASGTTGAAADIHCLLEIEELDLFFNDLALQIHVPSDMCSYLREEPYHFYAYEPGVGPTTASVDVYTDGSFNNGQDVNSAGEPECDFDYTPNDGPNCCLGTFTFNRRTEIPQDPAVPPGTGPFELESTQGEWGGTIGACIAGPGKKTQQLTTDQLIPRPSILFIEGTGTNRTYTIPKALGETVAEQTVSSNIWAANYWDVANPSYVGLPLDNLDPGSVDGPPALSRKATYLPNRYYTWSCLDRAEDLNARIRLTIREWNTDPIAAGGDPDESGSEADFPDQSVNDRSDVDDYGNDFPQGSI